MSLADYRRGSGRRSGRYEQQFNPYRSIHWVQILFPSLGMTPQVNQKAELESEWDEESLAFSKSLLRTDHVREADAGIEIARRTSAYNAALDRLVTSSKRLELWSQDRWLTRDYGQAVQPIVNWLEKETRGVYSEAFLLGRQRPSIDVDAQNLPFALSDFSIQSLHQAYKDYQATIERSNEKLVVLKYDSRNSTHSIRFTIDTERDVLLSQESLTDGNVTSTTTYSEFVEVAGRWWATRIETVDPKQPQRVMNLVTQQVRTLGSEDFAITYETNQALANKTFFLSMPLPSVRAAKQSDTTGTCTSQDRFVLLLHHSMSQKWKAAFEQLRALETLVQNKSGTAWVRIAVELSAARNEDARQGFVTQIEQILSDALPQAAGAGWSGGDLFLTTHTLAHLYNSTSWNEYGALLDRLKPVFSRQTEAELAGFDWKTRWLEALDSLDSFDAALALQQDMLRDVPRDVNLRTQYAERLDSLNRPDEAIAFLQAELAKAEFWEPSQRSTLQLSCADILEGHGRYEEVLTLYEAWLPLETTQSGLFARYLEALALNDSTKEVETTTLAWLKLLEQEGELSPSDQGKINAAIQFALGFRRSNQSGDERFWFPTLYETANDCLRRDDRIKFTQSIAHNSYFGSSDEGDRLRGNILQLLLDASPQPLPPTADETAPLQLPIDDAKLAILLDLLSRTLDHGRLLLNDGDAMQVRDVTLAEWQTLADTLLKWWNATPDEMQKDLLSNELTDLYWRRLPAAYIPFLRLRVDTGPQRFEANYRQALFTELLYEPWTMEIEAEAFALWPTLSPATSRTEKQQVVPVMDAARTVELVPSLQQLVDTMLENRVNAAQERLQEAGHVDAATRTERATSQADIRSEALKAMAERLQAEWEKQQADNSLLSDWIMAEKIYIEMLLDRNHDEVLKWAWATIGDTPPMFTPPNNLEENADRTAELP